MKTLSATAAALGLAVLVPGANAAPIPLLDGAVIGATAFEAAGVTDTDPDWTGTTLGMFRSVATRMEDGFDGSAVVADLYNVEAVVDATVVTAANGQLVFRYAFSAFDLGGFSELGGPNGASGFDLTGFAGYDLTLAWDNMSDFSFTPLLPAVSRSSDGDTLGFAFSDPRAVLDGPQQILLQVGAPSFSDQGGGTAAIFLDTFPAETSPLVGALPAPAPIPLPAGAALLLCALGGLTLLRRGRA